MILEHPLQFEPLFMERAWGGRRLETLFGKHLPAGTRIGESWEIIDRDEAQSVVHDGILKGKTLRELWADHRDIVFGEAYRHRPGPFPILVKLLDTEERLSVQVHPPAAVAARLGGEPKDEIWIIAEAKPDADLFVGFEDGVTRDTFEEALAGGNIAGLLRRLPSAAGESIFIPSGCIHAIGAGNIIIEVQQNSDTTYRLFDWNRLGLDGKPRQLHVEQSRESILFDLPRPAFTPRGENSENPLVECPYFRVEKIAVPPAGLTAHIAGEFAIFIPLDGLVECAGTRLAPGHFFLLPAGQQDRTLAATGNAVVKCLRITLPH